MIRARFTRVIKKILSLRHSRRVDEELAREIALHVALLEEEYQQHGMSPQEARTAARRRIGGVEQTIQAHRDERSILWLEHIRQDLHYACRTLTRNRGFSVVAVITLGLGIGVNATLFTAYDAIALKPLPVADPERVVRLERWFANRRGDVQYAFSWPEYLYCRSHQDVFSDLVAASWPVRVLAAMSGSDKVTGLKALQGQLVSGNYFRSFGVEAKLGRTFGQDEDSTPGANPVMVLSYSFWQRQFHGVPDILGRLVRINGNMYSIIGVTPQEFTGTSLFPQVPDFWAPASMQAQLLPGRDWLHHPMDYHFQMLGRLKTDIGLDGAEAETATLIRQFSSTYTSPDPTLNVRLQHTAFFPNTEDPRFKAGVAALMLIVAMVLFIACANVANMLLARGVVRQPEISLRLALGSSRGRIIRQLITESIVLSLVGGFAGLALSVAATKFLRVAVEQTLTVQFGADFAFSLNLNPDARVLVYSLLLSILAGIIFGLSPALQFTKPELVTAIRDQTTLFGHALRRSYVRGLLAGGQVAVSMLLLTCSALLVRGLMKSHTADPGFETRRLFVLRADYGDNPARSTGRFRSLVSRLQAVPELASVAYGREPMLGTWTPPILVGRSGSREGIQRGRTLASYASQDYLKTLGITLLRGRDFTGQESGTGTHVAVISEATARKFWPTQDPLGRHFQLDLRFNGKFTDFEVIGVAKDVRFSTLTRIDPAHVYLAPDPSTTYPILLNVGADQQTALAAVWKVVSSSDPDLLPAIALWNTEAMLVHPQKMFARVMAIFAACLALLAVSLTGVGIYGVMAYVVSQKTHEIGIEMALGASSDDVLRSVALWGLRPVVAGMIIGLFCGAAASAVLHSTLAFPGSIDFLYGVRFYDPRTFLGVSIFVVAVSLLASLVPAVKAVRVEPIIALRYE